MTVLDVDRVLSRYLVIIGAQRSGSTLLYRILDDHPDISMVKPPRPEPKIFLQPDLDRTGLEQWLETRLSNLDQSAKLFGEKSTSYIESDVAAGSMARLVPDVRLLAIVRDPVRRAVSNYRFSVANGLETDSVETALSRELDGGQPPVVDGVSVSPFAYLDRGCYHRHLDRFAGHGERLRVVVMENLTSSPSRQGELFRWLGVDDAFRSDTTTVNAGEGPDASLSPDLERRLRRHFEPANEKLARQFDLDLSSWR